MVEWGISPGVGGMIDDILHLGMGSCPLSSTFRDQR